MQSRLTIDLDTRNKWNLMFYLIGIALYIKNVKKTEIRNSVNKGYHIIIWLDKPVTNKEHFKLRKKFGDDKFRMELDKKRLNRQEPINILFTEKTDFYYIRKRKV